MKIASDSIFDPDIFADPVIGIASDIGKHDSGKHCHLRHQLLFSAAGSITIEIGKMTFYFHHDVLHGFLQAQFIERSCVV